MRSLFLHVGLHKTGTTYLQKLLGENRDTLLGAGLGLGPFQDPELGTHHPIIAAMERLGPEKVFAQAARCPGDKLLVSAEDLSHVLLDPVRARAIRDAAGRHFDVKIVIFLRRQDHLAESYYAEAVKSWHAGPVGEAGLDGARWIYELDHAKRIARLEDVFGKGNVLVRLYRDGGPNDLVGELFSAIGLDPEAVSLRRPAKPLNVALHRRKVLFLSRVPKWRGGADGPPRASFPFRFLRRVMGESEAIADDGYRHMMPPSLRRRIVEAHLSGNRALAARFDLPRNTGFLDLPSGDNSDWAPPAPITVREFFGLLWDVYREAWTSKRLRSALMTGARLSLLLGTALPRLRLVRGTRPQGQLTPAE
jgi:hypothetical protein